MALRPEMKRGRYNIVCSICGVSFKDNLIILDPFNKLPICVFDRLEPNLDPGRTRAIVPAKVSNATGDPEPTYITYDTP